ncbi:MAG: biotin transporter BioY [Clostridia bacterium]|nr:biotin transporter BioY [Clostridia bacterium]
MKNHTRLYKLVSIALTAAGIAVIAPFSVPIGPVPLSLASFGCMLAVYLLSYPGAVYAAAIYLLLGFSGLPVFSGFTGGFQKLAGPTGGYLLGYLLLVSIAGWFSDKLNGEKKGYLLGFLIGTAALYALGTVWLMLETGLTLKKALFTGVLPFLPGDAVKICLAMKLGPLLRDRIRRRKD